MCHEAEAAGLVGSAREGQAPRRRWITPGPALSRRWPIITRGGIMALDESAAAGGSRNRRLTAEHVAARALVDAVTFAEAAPKILEAICESFGWEHGALWVVDRDAAVLRCVEIWSPPSVSFPAFDAVSRQTTFPRGVGLPGRVWADAKPVWIPDVGTRHQLPSRTHRRAGGSACRVRIPHPPARGGARRDGILQRRDPGA